MITSRHNRWLKDIRRLRTSKGRRRDRRLLLEGPHLVGEAVEQGLEPDVVLFTERFCDSPAAQRILDRLQRPPLLVAADLLDEIADADSPRGLVALIDPPAREIPIIQDASYIYVDGLQDPGNLGALARVAEAAGVEGLFLSPDSVSPSHPRALRASAGSLLRLPFSTGSSAASVSELFDGRATWVKLVARGGRDLYGGPSIGGARILAVGAEGQGLSTEVESRAGVQLTIPMAGRVESLNATVSAAVVLFEWRRRASEARSDGAI